MIPICIYSHSDFFDILKIQLAYFKGLFKGTNQEIYLFVNTPYMEGGRKKIKHRKRSLRYRGIKRNTRKQTGGSPDNFSYKTIIYDDKMAYLGRLANCIQQVNAPYMILIQDNDILIRYNKDIVEKIANTMKEQNIDTVEFKIYPNTTDPIHLQDSISIVKKSITEEYTFCVQPRIVKKESAIDLYTKFSTNDYKGSEGGAIQEYTRQTQKTYCIQDPNAVRSTRAFICSIFFCYIHLPTNSNLIKCSLENKLEPFIQTEHENIYKN